MSNADLIAEARIRVEWEDHPDEWLELIEKLADALEESDNWTDRLGREMRSRELHHFEAEQIIEEIKAAYNGTFSDVEFSFKVGTILAKWEG